MTTEANHAADDSSAESVDDWRLLQRYVQQGDERAFAVLVQRHLDFVYSAARRRLGGDAHGAADVAQQVFTALARQAAKLPEGQPVPAWLYGTTRHLSANFVRAERARRVREATAQRMSETTTTRAADEEWDRLRPLLDEVIDQLGERDRGAVVLRFFARRSFVQIAATLQVSEDAARMRVERALDRLRAALARRGVMSTAGALGTVLAHHAVSAAPAGVAATVLRAALQGGAHVGAMTAVMTFMSTAKFSLGVGGALVAAGAIGVAWYSPPTEAPRDTADAVTRSAPAIAASSANENRGTDGLRAVASSVRAAQPVASERPQGTPAFQAPRRESAAATPGNVAERRADRLHALVQLTAEQRSRAMELFAKEAALLEAIPLEERGPRGMEARTATRDQVRALLTPEQRAKYDVSPQSAGGGLAIDPANLVTRLDQAVKLTVEQKQKVAAVIWDDVVEQVAALPADEQLPGFRWSDRVRDRLRALLTPEQRAVFDETPPYRKNVRR